MTANRQDRRAEQRRARETLSRKVEARAASKRHARRMDNKKDGQEINRMRARRKFGVPDEPTWWEEAIQTIQVKAEALGLLLAGSETKSLGMLTIAAVILVAFAVAAGVWWSAASQPHAHRPQGTGLEGNRTDLSGIQLDLIPVVQ